jgi:hypothetical protein
MKELFKRAKVDIGLVPQTINNSNATGRYYHFNMFRKLLAILQIGAMAATKTVKIELLQAKDGAGTDAKGIPSTAGQTAVAEVTANTNVTKATLTCASVLATEAVTINGLVFTAAAAEDLTKRIFAVGANDTACAASLVKAINHASMGVPGLTAESALGVITLKSTNSGETLITIEDAAATITAATTEAQAYVELDVGSLDLANGFEYVAVKVTSSANGSVAALIVEGDNRFEPVQAVGASASV